MVYITADQLPALINDMFQKHAQGTEFTLYKDSTGLAIAYPNNPFAETVVMRSSDMDSVIRNFQDPKQWLFKCLTEVMTNA